MEDVSGRKRNHSSCSSDEDDVGGVRLRNPNIKRLADDVLYHFALGTKSHDLKAMFGDVKFVCVGGSPRRMEKFAYFMLQELKLSLPAGQTLVNIAKATDRYALYKVGPVLAASHGMGIPSISIMLHEILKLVHHAHCKNVLFLRMGTCGGLGTPSLSVMMHELIKILYHAEAHDVTFYRMGTCGGVGLEPGTVVVTEAAVDALLRPQYEIAILGEMVRRPAVLDKHVTDELVGQSREEDGFKVLPGKTMCTLDFYEGQGRLDGAFCDYTEQDKMNFLRRAYDSGVRNIEMESLCFAAMCHHAGVKCGVACVTLLDRLQGDQITAPPGVLKQWDERPATILARVIRKRLGMEE